METKNEFNEDVILTNEDFSKFKSALNYINGLYPISSAKLRN